MSAYGTYKIGTQSVVITGTIGGDVVALLTYTAGAKLAGAKFPQSTLLKFVRSMRNAPLSTASAECGGNFNFDGLFSGSWNVLCTETGQDATTTKTTTRTMSLSVFGGNDSFNDVRNGLSNQAFAGSFALTIPCDICIRTTQPQTGSGDLAPFWQRIEDTPLNTALEILLIPVPDTSVTGTLTVAGVALSVTANTGADPAPLGYGINYGGTAVVSSEAHIPMSAEASADQAVTVTSFLALSSIAGSSKSVTAPKASASASTGAGIATVAAACNALRTIADNSSASSTSTRSESGDRSAKMQAELYYMDSPSQVLPGGANVGGYLGAVEADLIGMGTTPIAFTAPFADPGTTPVTGRRFERANTQRRCSQSLAIFAEDDSGTLTDSDSTAFDDYSAISAALTQSSLVAQGDDPTARRLLIRGGSYNAAYLGLADTFQIDNCLALTIATGNYAGAWSITSGGSLSIESATFPGPVTADVIRFSGGGKTLSRSFDNPSYLANYRFLRLRVRADGASKSLTVTINTKAWTITTSSTTSAWEYQFIDLDLPPNKTETTDGTDTRWPEDAAGLPTEGVYFGVGSTTLIEITGLESGVVYELEDVSLSLNPAVIIVGEVVTPMYFSDLDLIQTLGYLVTEKPDSVVSESGTTTQFLTSRFFYMRPDITGQAADEPAFLKQVTTGGVSGVTVVVYTHRTIAGLLAKLGNKKYPGFTLTDYTPAPTPSGAVHPPATSEYYNSDLPAVYLGGAGLVPAGVTDALRSPYFTVSSNMEITPPGDHQYAAVGLYDSVLDWFPGCGNIFNIGDYETVSGRLLLRLGSILRGAGHGLVADTSHHGAPDVAVTLYQATVSRGSALSDNRVGTNAPYGVEGIFYTHNPYSQLGSSTLETQDEAISFTAYTRKRQRGVFLAALNGDVIAMSWSGTQRVVRAFTTSGGILILEFWRWTGAGVGVWDRVTTTLTLTGGGALSYDRKGSEQRLWLDYEDSGAIKSRYTDDEGGNFSVATTIAATGTYPALTHSPTSVAHHFWVDGSAIKTKALDSQGNELVAASTVVASAVAASPIAAVHDGETILLTYKNSGGAVITVLSTDGGVTFS